MSTSNKWRMRLRRSKVFNSSPVVTRNRVLTNNTKEHSAERILESKSCSPKKYSLIQFDFSDKKDDVSDSLNQSFPNEEHRVVKSIRDLFPSPPRSRSSQCDTIHFACQMRDYNQEEILQSANFLRGLYVKKLLGPHDSLPIIINDLIAKAEKNVDQVQLTKSPQLPMLETFQSEFDSLEHVNNPGLPETESGDSNCNGYNGHQASPQFVKWPQPETTEHVFEVPETESDDSSDCNICNRYNIDQDSQNLGHCPQLKANNGFEVPETESDSDSQGYNVNPESPAVKWLRLATNPDEFEVPETESDDSDCNICNRYNVDQESSKVKWPQVKTNHVFEVLETETDDSNCANELSRVGQVNLNVNRGSRPQNFSATLKSCHFTFAKNS